MKLFKTLLFAGVILAFFAGCRSSKAEENSVATEETKTETVTPSYDENDVRYLK